MIFLLALLAFAMNPLTLVLAVLLGAALFGLAATLPRRRSRYGRRRAVVEIEVYR